MLRCKGFLLVIAVLLVTARAVAAGYQVVPLGVAGGVFVPVALSDGGVVSGNFMPSAGGSLAAQIDAGHMVTADYCGTGGAADQTAVISVSPYSARQFILGTCDGTGYFLRDVAHAATTVPQGPPNSWAVIFDGVGNDGTLVGACCVGGLGPRGFYENGANYGYFGNTDVAYVSIGPRDTISYGDQFECETTTYVKSASLAETIRFTIAQNWPFDTVPAAANAAGDVIGTYWASCGAFQQPPMPYFWTRGFTPGGRFVFPPGALNMTPTHLVALNERGVVAGNSIAGSGANEGFVWQPRTGQVVVIAPPAGASGLLVAAINNHGAVAGTYVVGGRTIPFVARCAGAGCP